MTPVLTLPPLLDDQGTGWLLLVLVVLLVAAALWRRLRRVPSRRRRPSRPGGATRRSGSRPPQAGEIWWADVPFEDGTGSKDRPCLVVAEHGHRRQVLMITSSDKSGRSGYVPVERAGWGRGDGVSWLRVDRRVALESAAFRRYAGACPPTAWSVVTSGR